MEKLVNIFIMVLLVSGCARQQFSINKGMITEPGQTVTHHFFVSGIGQSKAIDASEVCGGSEKIVRTEVQQTFVNGLLSFITFGIYTPREARVYCAK